MNSIVFTKMAMHTSTLEETSGIRGLFAFAVDDYRAAYNRSKEDVEEFTVFGAVLAPVDVTDDFFELIERLTDAHDDIKMLVFDISRLRDDEIAELRRFIEMDELKDVYEDRIVFARA